MRERSCRPSPPGSNRSSGTDCSYTRYEKPFCHPAFMTDRIFNFAAGPAVLPLPVLEEIQRDLVALPGIGMSVLELSHRSSVFESVLERAERDVRTLAGIPASYRVLFLQGGASLQFSMVP